MQTVTAVEPYWLAELGPMFFTVKDEGKQSGNPKGAVCTTLRIGDPSSSHCVFLLVFVEAKGV